MKLESITVENYRQFEKAELTFDEGITILAGANNSGKTSLINLIKNIFVDDKLNYNMSDIPAKNMREWVEWVYPIFQKFFRDRKTEENVEKDLLNVVIPKEETDSTHLMKMTTVKIHVSYNPDMDDIKLFADCIMDLDETKHDFYFMYNFEIVHTQFAREIINNFSKIKHRFAEIEEKKSQYAETTDELIINNIQVKESLDLDTVRSNINKISYNETPFNSLLYGGLGHNDLITFTKLAVDRFPIIKKKISDKYQLIFIDEYQDTSAEVLHIFYISLVGKKSKLYLLGDKMQQIYKNYNGEFEEKLETFNRSVNLSINYRTTPKIVDILNYIYNDEALKQCPYEKNSNDTMAFSPKVLIVSDVEKAISDFRKTYEDALLLYVSNRARFYDIGASNLYDAYNKMEKYQFWKKYSAVDVMTKDEARINDALLSFLFIVDQIIEYYLQECYGEVFRNIHEYYMYFNSEKYIVEKHRDKKTIKTRLEKIKNSYVDRATTIDGFLNICFKEEFIEEEIYCSIIEDDDYQLVKDVYIEEVRKLTNYLNDPRVSTQHGVKGESHDTVVFVADNSSNPAVHIAIMQNKFERGMVDYDKSFKAQMNQLFLLKERPEFRYKNNTIDMLKKARLPSIGNYGTFRQNASPYEMGYYSADCLLHRANCAGPRSQCKIRLDVGVNKTDKIAGYIQENYCENIAEFGDALIGMRIGEPYLLLNAIKILNNINIVNVLRQWDMAIEYEVDDRRPSITCRDIILVNVRQYYETKNDRKIRSIKERLEKEGELLEMKKPEEEFIDAMRYLFGEEFVKNEKFTEKYKKVLKRDDELKAHYGDCDSVKQLMLYIRKNMRKYGYAPNYKLPEIFENNELDYNKYREAVIEGMRNSKFEKLFPETYTYEFKRNKLEYDTDGWNYNKMDYQEEDWICKKRGSYHCYYNQLDHYLSHLLSVIRKNSEMGNCQGIEPVRMELKQKIDSYCMAKKER